MIGAVSAVVTRSGARPLPSLWRGTVSEVHVDGTVWVVVPKLAGPDPVGPLPTAARGLLVGEQVIVGAIEASRNDLLVVSRLIPENTATKAYVDAAVATRAPLAHTHAAVDVTTGILDPARLPAATASIQGAMSAVDKAKLDAASATTVASTLAVRSAAGHLYANVFLGDAAQSAAVNAMTRKDYVDAQVATRAPTAHGHAYTDITGTVPSSALPPLAITEVFPVASQAAMLALTAQRGDVAVRSDTGKTYILTTDSPGTLADWTEILATGQVVSVAGKTGAVALVKGDVGLGSVDNTSDLAKPVSSATQTALNGKEATITAGTTAQYWRGDKTWQALNKTAVGLGSVDNTSDLAKPISTATQTALDGKAPTAHTHTFSSLTDVDETPRAFTYANSWTNFDATTYWATKTVESSPGLVLLSGMPKPGTISEGVVIGSVHADHIPNRHVYCPGVARYGTSQAAIMIVVRHTTGNVEVYGLPGTTAYIPLSVTYRLNGAL